MDEYVKLALATRVIMGDAPLSAMPPLSLEEQRIVADRVRRIIVFRAWAQALLEPARWEGERKIRAAELIVQLQAVAFMLGAAATGGTLAGWIGTPLAASTLENVLLGQFAGSVIFGRAVVQPVLPGQPQPSFGPALYGQTPRSPALVPHAPATALYPQAMVPSRSTLLQK